MHDRTPVCDGEETLYGSVERYLLAFEAGTLPETIISALPGNGIPRLRANCLPVRAMLSCGPVRTSTLCRCGNGRADWGRC